VKLTVTVNGRLVSADIADRTLPVHFIRQVAGLTARALTGAAARGAQGSAR
jgi:aerobic-type carbon monoxide dehydrogenase small subunit (CoxS/CutS family)